MNKSEIHVQVLGKKRFAILLMLANKREESRPVRLKMNPDLFAEKFEMALHEKGMKATDLARKSHLTAAAISNFRHGKRRPKDETLSSICNVLNVEEAYFTDDLIGVDEIFKHKKEKHQEQPQLTEKEKKMEKIHELLKQWLLTLTGRELDCIIQLLNALIKK